MNPTLWIICGLFAFWGLVYLVVGIARKVVYQVMTGVAVILLAASMPLTMEPNLAGWLLVAVAIPLAVAAVVMRVLMLFGRREGR